MLERITATAQKPKPEYHGVLDEHAASEGTIGSVLAVFPNASAARRFAANVREAARIARAGSNIKWAFAPHVNTDVLQRITSEAPNVRVRIVRLTSDLPPGAPVHPRLNVESSGPPRGSLRCLWAPAGNVLPWSYDGCRIFCPGAGRPISTGGKAIHSCKKPRPISSRSPNRQPTPIDSFPAATSFPNDEGGESTCRPC